jgi:hypothetical protein
LGVLCNDLIENGWIGHDTGHLLKELRRVHHRLELWSEVKKLKLKNAQQRPYTQRTILGSLGFRPISANGFKPAIAPYPMWLFS